MNEMIIDHELFLCALNIWKFYKKTIVFSLYELFITIVLILLFVHMTLMGIFYVTSS